MNAYFCLYPKEIQVIEWEDWFAGTGHYVYYQPADLIFAETRGKARAIFCAEHDLEYTEKMSIHKVASHVNREEGIARFDDVLWLYVNPLSWTDEYYNENTKYIINELRDYPAN